MFDVDARPYPYAFEPRHAALLVIDMQRDFIEPGGFGAALGNDVSRLAPAVPGVARVLNAFRERDLLVVHTKECHAPPGSSRVANAAACENAGRRA